MSGVILCSSFYSFMAWTKKLREWAHRGIQRQIDIDGELNLSRYITLVNFF
jgi:hypothetical protein